MDQQGSEPALRSHLSSHSSAKFYFLYYPFTIFHIFATNCYHPSLLLGLGNLLPHLATSCHDMPTGPLLAGWVSIKWRGLTPRRHHKQGWISIKRRGLTPHLHHNTVAVWRRAEDLDQQGSEPTLRSHLSSHSSAKFYFLPTGLGNLLPHLATTCHDWALAGRVGLYKMQSPPPAP